LDKMVGAGQEFTRNTCSTAPDACNSHCQFAPIGISESRFDGIVAVMIGRHLYTPVNHPLDPRENDRLPAPAFRRYLSRREPARD
jgi:hypothetical protein